MTRYNQYRGRYRKTPFERELERSRRLEAERDRSRWQAFCLAWGVIGWIYRWKHVAPPGSLMLGYPLPEWMK